MYINEGVSYFVINRRKSGTGTDYKKAPSLCSTKFGSEANLVTIGNSRVMEMLKSILMKDLSEVDPYSERYWIGLKREKGGDFLWQNGDAMNYR